MALFDSIISEASEKFDLGDKAGTLLSALLALMTNQETGGFGGFVSRFNDAGLGDTVTSWITGGDNAAISDEEVKTAIGSETVGVIAEQVGIPEDKATSAIAYMLPQVVDRLTPDGEVPNDESLLSSVGGTFAGAAGVAGATAGGAAEATGDTESAVSGKVNDAFENVGEAFDGDGDNSILKWLLPLLLLGLLLLLGFWFCRGNQVATTTNENTNTNVNAGETVTNVNAGETATTPEGEVNSSDIPDNKDEVRKLTEVSLPDGTKLQAFPGGIEDELVKFLQSDDYKNATPEELKDKWFDFDDLNFKSGTTELVPESQRQLENVVAILKAFPDVKLKVGGYTDKKGDDAENKKLSDERAKAVKAALEKEGVGAQVPEAEGYGEEFAKVDEASSDEERASDRKTSVRLLK